MSVLTELVREECEARGWSEDDFAKIMGTPTEAITALLDGQAPIDDVMALALALAFGTSPELWEEIRHANIVEVAPDSS